MGFLGERGESEGGGTTYRVNNMKPNVYGFFLLGIATTNFLFFKI
jgi:hypothetical protein